MPATQRGTHLQEQQIDCLGAQLDALIDWGVDLGRVIAIPRFREVADRLRSLAAQRGILSGGTIHTAQGREADAVPLSRRPRRRHRVAAGRRAVHVSEVA
ncbi:hypothetical protein BW737_005630 [Actinomyces ruminis]|uniref:Uncharacterized protein n=1 Tax=Actinomyces ruminis TaxID=1937003 RepID=A0ABX4MBZ5_9ACTO|nr:hypothetical protein BW737_005630 [Actinomyces ruminis]